jgi:hypothetical protein
LKTETTGPNLKSLLTPEELKSSSLLLHSGSRGGQDASKQIKQKANEKFEKI